MQNTKTVAQNLIGKRLLRRLEDGTLLSGIINETEAYLGAVDKACHTYGDKKTPRTASMYLRGGHAYVYIIYGIYYCFNVVTRSERHGEAVLIRSIVPEQGESFMKKKRLKAKSAKSICDGPGKLCQALQICRRLDGHSLLTSKKLWIEYAFSPSTNDITATPRIGMTDKTEEWHDKPLRFYWKRTSISQK